MYIVKRIAFLIVGTILVVLGALGLYGMVGLTEENSSPIFLASQAVIPIALFIIGFFLLSQFYKRPKNKDKVK